jgi:hypothetical protein
MMYDDDDDRMWLRVTRLRGKGVEFGARGWMVLQGPQAEVGGCVLMHAALWVLCDDLEKLVVFHALCTPVFFHCSVDMQVLLLPREARVV